MDKEQIKEIEEDLGEKIEDFEEDNEIFRFTTEDGTDYEGCENEAVAERIARDCLESDNYFWKQAVASDHTTLGFDDWVDHVLNMDGWQHELCRYDGDYKETKNGIVYWRV